MLLVIDTNILVNALRSNNDKSKSVRLMDDVFSGVHTMCVSEPILNEYRDVLSRPQLHITAEEVEMLMRWIRDYAYHIEPKPSTQEAVAMKDEDDRIFFDVAKCLNARLVTRNYKDYPTHELITLIDELY